MMLAAVPEKTMKRAIVINSFGRDGSRRSVVLSARQWVIGKCRCAMLASKSSWKHASAQTSGLLVQRR
jgi:hypothetical protein